MCTGRAVWRPRQGSLEQCKAEPPAVSHCRYLDQERGEIEYTLRVLQAEASPYKQP